MSTQTRVALVTGASRGLGAAIATALAADGAAVAVNYARDTAAADAVVAAIGAAGGRAAAFRADVTDQTEVARLHEAVVAELGEVDVLVANATGPQPEIGVESLRVDDLLTQLRFFAVSPLLLTQRVLPAMRHRRWGRIVQIGSEAFELGTRGSSAYVAAKGAQLGLTRSWARELGGTGITVNLVAPGFIPTERHVGVPDADRDRYTLGVPMGRLGTADDVAAAVAYLASDRAGFVTGQRIAVNGGNTL